MTAVDRGAAPHPGPWQTARVNGIRRETPTAKSFTLTLSESPARRRNRPSSI